MTSLPYFQIYSFRQVLSSRCITHLGISTRVEAPEAGSALTWPYPRESAVALLQYRNSLAVVLCCTWLSMHNVQNSWRFNHDIYWILQWQQSDRALPELKMLWCGRKGGVRQTRVTSDWRWATAGKIRLPWKNELVRTLGGRKGHIFVRIEMCCDLVAQWTTQHISSRRTGSSSLQCILSYVSAG